MAARVTKLFLQNCIDARSSAVGKKSATAKGGKLGNGNASMKVQAAASKNSRRRKNSKAKGKSTVRFLDAAQKEQKTSDKTKENLTKLKTRANDKSKRLMAKALEKRQAIRL